MDTCEVDFFIHEVKYFIILSWESKQPAGLAYDRLFNRAKSHETAMTTIPPG